MNQTSQPGTVFGRVTIHHVFIALLVSQICVACTLVGLAIMNLQRIKAIRRVEAAAITLQSKIDDLHRKIDRKADKP